MAKKCKAPWIYFKLHKGDVIHIEGIPYKIESKEVIVKSRTTSIQPSMKAK